MARIRTLKPDFWKHEGLCEQPEATHMLAAALLNYVDDYGYFNANPALIKGELFPLREPSVSIPESLRRLQAIDYIRLGTTPDGRRYGMVVNFSTHQRVSHPTASKIKDLTITWDNSGEIPETSANPPETFGPEGNGREGKWNKESGASAPDNSFDFSPFKPLPHDGPTQSAEDEFWELVNTQSKSGALSRAMMVKHAKLSRDFHDSVSCIKSALRAKNPRTYLGKAISNISEEQRAPPEPEGF